jgi:hypothetical protein
LISSASVSEENRFGEEMFVKLLEKELDADYIIPLKDILITRSLYHVFTCFRQCDATVLPFTDAPPLCAPEKTA